VLFILEKGDHRKTSSFFFVKYSRFVSTSFFYWRVCSTTAFFDCKSKQCAFSYSVRGGAMSSSNPAADTSAEIAVNFVRDDALVPEPKARIPTTDVLGRAPRNAGSRRITFADDGKLFEGHFTVQSTNLKSIIQYLLDRHDEQDVVIQDLQKQVHMLRSRSLKLSKRGGGAEGNGPVVGSSFGGAGASSDLGKRLKRVEQFLQLWGVQLNDVAELVEEYGDPTITPDAYTSYLLDLPAFRLTRREARALILNATQPTAASANAAAASDTATRRRTSSAKRDNGSSAGTANTTSAHEEKTKSEAPEKHGTKKANEADGLAEATLEKATAALKKAEMLLAELHNTIPRASPAAAPKPRRAEPASKITASTSNDTGAAIDAEARADIEELGDYVMQRLDELEARTAMMIAHSALPASAPAQHDRNTSRQTEEAVRGGEAVGKKNQRPSPVPPPLPRAATNGGRGDEVVDAVAREDAAASLDLLEELEATMERRFKELGGAVANIAARTAALAKSSINNSSHSSAGSGNVSGGGVAEKTPQRTTPPVAEEARKAKEQVGAAAAVAASEDDTDVAESGAPLNSSRTNSPSMKKSAAFNRKGRQHSSDSGTLVPVLPTAAAAPANLVDQIARDDTVALAKRVNELEEELLDRWQAMEERLRIIGRAAMKQGVTNAAGNGAGAGMAQSMGRTAAVDRKAREDAALSLMRLQQVERELVQLKRQYAAGGAGSLTTGGAELRIAAADDGNQISLPSVIPPSVPSAPLRDTYGSKVADLEKEVEQRMTEVNQAIAQLRGAGNVIPLTLSPPKGGRNKISAAVAVVAAAPQGELEATLPPPPPTTSTTSQLTLRAEDGNAVAVLPAASTDIDERRRAALQSMAELGYDVDGDTNLFTDFPRTSVRIGGRRTTISRLRSPDIPPFGTHLVQREVVEIPLVTVTKTVSDGNAGYAAAATTPVQAARRVSNANGSPSPADGQAHSTSPHHSSKVSSVVAQHA
jgi:hypothetical protein